MQQIADLITLPEIKTVIYLKQALEPGAEALQTDLVFTQEVNRAFQAIFASLAEEKGKGFFIEGGYGSGKSHFLACLYLYLKSQTTPPVPNLPKVKGPWLVIPISLLDYGNEFRLQEIVLETINNDLESCFHKGLLPPNFMAELERLLETNEEALNQLAKQLNISKKELFTFKYWPHLHQLFQKLNLPYRPVLDREVLLKQLKQILKEEGYKGAILLVDELSEFLKSKPTIPAFQEDIRFLQFLGEAAQDIPLWIIAALQERLETTGDIPQDAFAKIKDRYPVRLLFAGAHIEEIVSERLVKKRLQAKAYLEELYEYFKQTFNYLPFDWEQWFKLYPVHPLTIQLLHELRGLFSQHRGAIDFVYSRLKGDTKRHIPSLLNAPPSTLLSPTLIFDHFSDRLRETLETNPYYEKVYGLYKQLIPGLFPDPETQKVALSLIKLLILLAVSPIKHHPTVKELTLAILHPFTDLDPILNFRFIHDILNQLIQKGAYLRHEPGKEFLEDKFYLDLEEDTQFIIRARFRQLKQAILPGDERIYQFNYQHAVSSPIPFKELSKTGKIDVNIIWQNTRREGQIHFVTLEKFLDSLTKIEPHSDFHLFILSLPLKEEVSLPPLPPGIGVWIPEKVNELYLEEAFIYGQLLERYQTDATAKGKKLQKVVTTLYQHAIEQSTQELTWAYRQGSLYFSQKEATQVVILDASSWLRLLEGIGAFILEKRYPLHHLIAPHTLPPPFFQRQQLANALIIPGEITLKREERGLKLLIEGIVRPLGILKKIPGGYQVVIEETRAPLIKHILEAFQTKDRWSTKELFEYLHWGKFGLCEEQYTLLLLALIHSGLLMPYHQDKRLSPTRINLSSLNKVDTIELTPTLSSEELNLLSKVPFLPQKFQGQRLTVTQQESLWQTLIEFKKNTKFQLQAIKTFLNKFHSHPIFAFSDLNLAQETLQQLEQLLEAIKGSLTATSGLKRFCETLREISFIDILWARFQAIHEFYEKREKTCFIYEYLHHPDLHLLPDDHGLKAHYKEVAEIFKKNLLFNPSALLSLEEHFSDFHKAYTQVYKEKHNSYLTPERFNDYFKLQQEPDYKLLKLWSSLPVLPARAYLEKIEKKLNKVLKQLCQADVEACLAESPVCACGWKLGQEVDLPSISILKNQIQEGINASMQALQSPPLNNRLETYIKALKEIGNKEKANQLASFLKRKGEIEEWLAITPELKNALLQGITVVERNLDTLITRLQGQNLPKSKLETIFKDWLEGREGLPPDAYVKVTVSTTGVPPALELALRELEPGFIPLAQKWKERFFSFLVFLAWCHFHKLPLSLAGELARIPETEWQDRQPSLLKLTLRLSEEEAFKQWAERIEDEDLLWQHLCFYQPNLSFSLERERLFPQLKSRILAYLLEKQEGFSISNLDEETKKLVLSYQKLLSLIKTSVDDYSTKEAWEGFLKEKLGHMEWMLGEVMTSNLPHTLKQSFLKQLTDWDKTLDKKFKQFYEQQKYAPLTLPPKGVAILLDGLRWDLWMVFKKQLLPSLGYKIEKEGFYWAQAPTDTFTQLTALNLEIYSENLSPGLHLLKKDALKIFKIDLIDTYIHQTHLFPHQIINEMIIQLKPILKPLLKGNKNVFLFSDHGFRMKMTSVLRPSYKQPLYVHGGVSPQEVIVPWASLIKNK